MTFNIRSLTERDVAEVSALAHRIWRQHYITIISADQIEYMLAQRHTEARYCELLEDGIMKCLVAEDDGKIIGFVVYGPDRHPQKIFVNSLYVQAESRGRGIGRKLLESLPRKPLTLRVNKANHDTIEFYKRYGFVVTKEDVLQLGHGFVMDDYLMECAA